MLTQAQIDQFNRNGYLVVEDLITQPVREAVKAEYEELLDALYAGWQSDGLVPNLAADATFGISWMLRSKGDLIGINPSTFHCPTTISQTTRPCILDQLFLMWSPVIASWTLLNA